MWCRKIIGAQPKDTGLHLLPKLHSKVISIPSDAQRTLDCCAFGGRFWAKLAGLSCASQNESSIEGHVSTWKGLRNSGARLETSRCLHHSRKHVRSTGHPCMAGSSDASRSRILGLSCLSEAARLTTFARDTQRHRNLPALGL